MIELIQPGFVCAELGVWKGEFAQRLLERQPAQLHLIDPWLYMPQYVDRWYGQNRGDGNDQKRMDAIHGDVVRLFAGRENVHIHRKTSDEAAATFPPDHFDFVYIDANHSYEFVKRDLELFLPLMKRGGFLTGDDYVFQGCPEGGPGRAVDELVARGGAKLVSVKHNQFILLRA